MTVEAMKLALAALEWNLPVIEDYGDKEQLNQQHKAITALRQAIEQAQEPVAWMCSKPLLMNFGYSLFSKTRGYGYDIPVYIGLPKDKQLTEKSLPLIDWESLITKQACVRVLETVFGIKEEA